MICAVGETVEIGNFDPKLATFWIDSGIPLSLSHTHTHLVVKFDFLYLLYCPADSRLKGVFLESGTTEVFTIYFLNQNFDIFQLLSHNCNSIIIFYKSESCF